MIVACTSTESPDTAVDSIRLVRDVTAVPATVSLRDGETAEFGVTTVSNTAGSSDTVAQALPSKTPTPIPPATATPTATASVTPRPAPSATQLIIAQNALQPGSNYLQPTWNNIPGTSEVVSDPASCNPQWFFTSTSNLVCPNQVALQSTGAFQRFQNGMMIWVEAQDSIYVMIGG